MASEASNRAKYLLATKVIDFANDVFKIILMQAGFSYNKATHALYADVSATELATGNGYTVADKVLAGVTVTEDNVNHRTNISWANASWTASGGSIGPAAGAIIYDDTVANDPIIGYIDFGGSQTQADGGVATISNIEIRISNV